jgi:RHS repeat-associated protein
MSKPTHVDQSAHIGRQVLLLATDRSGSIIGETVNGNTEVIAYSAYGERSARPGSTGKLGFNGQVFETHIGWYLLGNGYRAYNPRLMRFHSPDSWSPFRRGGLNPYMYCVGDPINYSDPTGHFLDALRLFFRENVAFGISATELAAKNALRNTKALARQQAMYALGAAGGREVAPARSSLSGALVEAGIRVGTSSKMPGGSPAIGEWGATTSRRYRGYTAAAPAGAGTYRPHPSTSSQTLSLSVSGRGRQRLDSFDAPRTLYDGPGSSEMIFVHEKHVQGGVPSGPVTPAVDNGPAGGPGSSTYYLSTTRPSERRWSGESGPSDWSDSSAGSSRSGSAAADIRKKT